jgi:site-specific DNA recombinase
MARARIYKRRSNEDQSELSPEAQDTQCRRWIMDNGHEVVEVYFDEDMSGRKEAERLDFQRLIRDAKADPGSIVVVHKFDRLCRDTELLLRVVYKELLPKGVRVESVMERFDPYTPLGKMMLTLSGGVSTYHSDNLATEIKKGLRAKYDQGNKVGPKPFGYHWQYSYDDNGQRIRGSGRLVFSPDADTARLAFELYGSGNYSHTALAAELNSRGLRQSRGKPFTREGIRKIIKNRFYIGKVRYKEAERDGLHEPLITQELWDRCQEIRARRTATRDQGKHQGTLTGIGVRPGGSGLLSELAYCGQCGAKLHWQWSTHKGGRTGYYRCSGHVNGGNDECDEPMLQAKRIEPLMLDVMRLLVIPPDVRAAVLAEVERRLEQPITGDNRPLLERQLERLKDLYTMGDMARAEYEVRRDALRTELVKLQPPQALLLDVQQALQFLDNLPDLLDAAPTPQRRGLFGTVFRRLWLEHYRITAIQPAPAFALLIEAAASQRGDVDSGSSSGFWAARRAARSPAPAPTPCTPVCAAGC